MAASRMRSALVLLALLSTLARSPSAAGNNAQARYRVDGKVERAERVASGFARAIGSGGGVNAATIMTQKYAIDAAETYTSLETNTIHEDAGDPDASPQLRGSMRRRLDLEDMLQEMARKNPEEWEASEWLIMILFLSFFGWLGCCLCSLCCCGRGGRGVGSNLLGWLCFWEICCRDGEHIDRCCDYALA